MIGKEALREAGSEMATCGVLLGVLGFVLGPLGIVTSVVAAWLGLRSRYVSRVLREPVALRARLAVVFGVAYWLGLVWILVLIRNPAFFMAY